MRALDKFLLEIEKPLMDEFVGSNGFKLYMDTTYQPEWKTCGWGTAKYIPQSFKTVKENDEVAISYHIIADRTYPETDENFHAITEDDPYLQKYKNAKGYWLFKIAISLPNNGGIKWVGFLQDDRMNWLDGAEGTQSDVERWMAQFSFGGDNRFTYKNLIQIGDKQYWRAEDFNIHAKIQDGEIVSLSNMVICRPIEVDKTTVYNIENNTILPPWTVVGMWLDKATVISGGEKLGLVKGDIVGFEPKFCEKYSLWGTECFLIKEERVDLIYEPEILSQSKNLYHGN